MNMENEWEGYEEESHPDSMVLEALNRKFPPTKTFSGEASFLPTGYKVKNTVAESVLVSGEGAACGSRLLVIGKCGQCPHVEIDSWESKLDSGDKFFCSHPKFRFDSEHTLSVNPNGTPPAACPLPKLDEFSEVL